MINKFFEIVTSICLPRNFTEARLKQRGYNCALVAFITIYLLVFGFSPLSRFLIYKLAGGEAPKPSLAIVIAAIAVFALGLALFGPSPLRDRIGSSFLEFTYLAYALPSRGALFVLKRRPLFRVIGICLILVGFGFVVTAHNFQSYSSELQQGYDSALRNVEEFAEFDLVASCRARGTLAASIDEIEKLSKLPGAAHFLNRNRCLDSFLAEVRSIYTGKCPTSEEAATIVEHLDTLSCPNDPRSEGLVRTWQGRVLLGLSEQGRIIDSTVRAHRMLLQAQEAFDRAEYKSSGVQNSLGVVFVHYAYNYETLRSSSYWESSDKVPELNRSPSKNGFVPFVSVLNTAIAHLRAARKMSVGTRRADFAMVRYENNIADLCTRLLMLRDKPYVSITTRPDPLEAVDALHRDEFVQLRKSPRDWIKKRREDLADRLKKSQIPEVLVTIAQLGSIEIEVLEQQGSAYDPTRITPSTYEWLTPTAAMQAAFLMGFREEFFFRNPEYMGMCSLVRSKDFGEPYARLVAEAFPGITAERTYQACNLKKP